MKCVVFMYKYFSLFVFLKLISRMMITLNNSLFIYNSDNTIREYSMNTFDVKILSISLIYISKLNKYRQKRDSNLINKHFFIDVIGLLKLIYSRQRRYCSSRQWSLISQSQYSRPISKMFFIFIHTVFVFFFWHFSWDFGITFFGKVAKVKF